MKKIQTTVTYKVPDWELCHLSHNGRPSTETCRFCVKCKHGYRCALYDTTLDLEDGIAARKCPECYKATYAWRPRTTVEDTEDQLPEVDPKTVIKLTMQQYRKIYAKLIKDGYPDEMADKLAQKMMLGGA